MLLFLTNSTFMSGPNLRVQRRFHFSVAMFEMLGSRAKDGETGIGRMRFDKGTIDDPCRDMNAR